MNFSSLLSPETMSALAGIIVVDLMLSSDNAVVIGMAAYKLQGRQRWLAILFGGGLAIVLRIVLTAASAFLLRMPALELLGGLVLVWVAYKVLKQDIGEDEGGKQASTLFEAMLIIVIADLSMSTDNILAIAALARDNAMLVFGLALSMALVMFAGGVVAMLMDRFPWIVYIGSFAIAYVAGELILKDSFFSGLIPGLWNALNGMQVPDVPIEVSIVPLMLGIAVPALATFRASQARAKAAAVRTVEQ